MLTIHKDSHLDHDLLPSQIEYIKEYFKDRNGFFIETIDIPGCIICSLRGPAVGHAPVPEDVVHYAVRGDRKYQSRMVMDDGAMIQSKLTVIAGPHDGQDCVLYTAFGGPLAPKEINDPTLKDSERAESELFWSQHALVA